MITNLGYLYKNLQKVVVKADIISGEQVIAVNGALEFAFVSK